MYSVDIFFGFDILMTFSTGYIDEQNDIEYDCKKVIINYITGWFAIDLVSIMPFDYIFDYITGNLEITSHSHLVIARVLIISK